MILARPDVNNTRAIARDWTTSSDRRRSRQKANLKRPEKTANSNANNNSPL
jgi:hypothetical protein